MQQRKQELQSTKDNIAYLNNEIARMEKDHEEMIGNPQRLEQYAREQYLMKRDNEDVYVIEK
jgi:cell division protein FtsB